MKKLWIRCNDNAEYNQKWPVIANAIASYPGTDELIICLNANGQQANCGTCINAEQAMQFLLMYIKQENIILQNVQQKQNVQQNVEQSVSQDVQQNVSQDVQENAEALPQENVVVETVSETVSETVTEAVDKTVVESTIETSVNETVAEPVIELGAEKTTENETTTEEVAEEKTVKEAEKEKIETKTYIIKDDKVEWIYPEKTGLEVFKEQWNTIIENTRNESKKVKDAEKAKIDFVAQQLINVTSLFLPFIENIASNEAEFEKSLRLPWKSAEKMSKDINSKMRALSKYGLMSLSGKFDSFEEAKKLAPFSWMYEYYMTDDKETETENILNDIKKKKEAELKKVADAKKEKERKEKERRKKINAIAKEKALKVLEALDEYKALDEKAQKKELAKKQKEFFDEAEKEFEATEAAKKAETEKIVAKYNGNDKKSTAENEEKEIPAEDNSSANEAATETSAKEENNEDGQMSLFDVFGLQ